MQAYAAQRQTRRARRVDGFRVLSDRHGIDHRLHRAFETRLTEHEQVLPALIRRQGAYVHVLKDVDAVLGKQLGMHREHLFGVLARYRLEPQVSAPTATTSRFARYFAPFTPR